jgi:hypothetical protein
MSGLLLILRDLKLHPPITHYHIDASAMSSSLFLMSKLFFPKMGHGKSIPSTEKEATWWK